MPIETRFAGTPPWVPKDSKPKWVKNPVDRAAIREKVHSLIVQGEAYNTQTITAVTNLTPDEVRRAITELMESTPPRLYRVPRISAKGRNLAFCYSVQNPGLKAKRSPKPRQPVGRTLEILRENLNLLDGKTIKELGETLKLSSQTLRKALQSLLDEGEITRTAVRSRGRLGTLPIIYTRRNYEHSPNSGGLRMEAPKLP